MRNALPANLPLVIVIFAAAAAVGLWAAARRPEPHVVLGAEPAPVTAAAETAEPPGTLGQPDGSVERMQYLFHELHAEGRHALCDVCAGQYRH